MTQPDPYPAYRFFVEIAGDLQAFFHECSGLEMKTETFEYKEGGLNTFVHKLPGQTSFSNLTLKWGSMQKTSLWEWYLRLATKPDKRSEKKNVSVIQYDTTGVEVRRWNLIGAYPVKWVGPSFSASQESIGVETLELAFDEFQFVKA